MPFLGIDLHKKVVQAALLDDSGTLLHNRQFPATREALHQYCRQYVTPETQVALEATTHTWAVAQILESYAGRVVVSNPLKTRAIAEAKIKTDRIDARVLADLLRASYLPEVWHPDPQTQARRRLTTERANLISDRTRLKNRIHAVLHQRLIEAPKGDLFSPRNLQWLRGLELDQAGRESVDRYLRLLAAVDAEIAALDKALAQDAWQCPQVKLLMTMPGVSIAVAEALVSALGDIGRFHDADHAAAYLGLVPSTYQSAEHCYHGPITKQGRSHARWMMVQAAQHMDSQPGPLGVFFRRKAKKHRNIAVVATAHKMVVIAWHMLIHNQPYRYSQPLATQTKLLTLRTRATGRKRKGGIPKGAPRPASYGTGQPTRGVPSLDEIYAAEQLPAIQPLPPGEQRALSQMQVQDFAAQVRQSRRIPRKP